MDLVSREIAPLSPTGEEARGESPAGGPPGSPLAAIAARAAAEQAEASSRGGRRVCRPRRRTSGSPRKSGRTRRRPLSHGEVIVGTLAGINDGGQPLVRHPLDPSGRIRLARTTVPVRAEHVDREVVLAFEAGDLTRPIVLGILLRPEEGVRVDPRGEASTVGRPIVPGTPDAVPLTLTAQDALILRCGKASITLTRAGKVLVRGTYLLSRSSGVNRIKGWSVQIN